MSQAGNLNSGTIPPGTYVETLTGNSGGAVGPNGSGNINTVGAGSITIAGNPGTNTTTTELTGITQHSLQVGGAGGNALTQLGVATNGQLPIGSTGADPVLAALTAGTGISVTNGAGSITIANTGGTVTSISAGTGITCTPNPITGTGTVALTTPVAIANGGTNATSFTQSNGIVTYNGTSLVNYAGPQIDSSGRSTNTTQPAFLVYPSANITNVTGDGTLYTCAWNTEVFDQGNNFASNTFTAPVTGKYQFNIAVGCANLSAAHTFGQLRLTTTANTFITGLASYGACQTSNNQFEFSASFFANMTAGDTATVGLFISNSTKTVSFIGGAVNSSFSGYLVC